MYVYISGVWGGGDNSDMLRHLYYSYSMVTKYEADLKYSLTFRLDISPHYNVSFPVGVNEITIRKILNFPFKF